MLSFFTKSKKVYPIPRSPFMFTFIDSELDTRRTQLESQAEMFQQLRDDFQHVLLGNNYDLFINEGSIQEIDKQLQNALLPEHRIQYINILGSIKFIRLQSSRSDDLEKSSSELFEQMIKLDGDVLKDLIEVLELNGLSSEISTSTMSGISSAGQRMSERINEDILTEGGNTVAQVKLIQDNEHVKVRILSLFDMLRTIALIEKNQ